MTDTDPAARGFPKLHQLLEAYKGELPGRDERALATLIGVEDGVPRPREER